MPKVCKPFNPKDNPVPLAVRFWYRVNKNGPIHPVYGQCWIWTGNKLPRGYGLINLNGRGNYSHRVSYLLHFGNFDSDLQVLHHCDNPSCVNPKHLFLGTDLDNRLDCVAKDRHTRGERQWKAILTDEIVIQARKRYKFKCHRNGISAMAREFLVQRVTLWEAVIGKTWKHIKDPAPRAIYSRRHRTS